MHFPKAVSAIAILCLLAGCTPQTNVAENPSENKTSIDTTDLESVIQNAMEEAAVPGLSAAVLQNGSVVWSGAFGVKTAGTEDSVEADTLFEAASLSKPVFAYAVLKLVDAGEFDLDKPLLSYGDEDYIVSSFFGTAPTDDRMSQITARMVLSHSTGLPNWRPQGGELALINPPGEKFGYSGEGFVLLQRVIEKLQGMPLDAFMHKMVFEPLGMPNSSYIWHDEFEGKAATRHDFSGAPARPIKNEEENAAASLITCANDYARFMAAILAGEGLTDKSHELIFTPAVQVAPDRDDGISWGEGVGLCTADDDTVFWHWGDNGDSKAFMAASRSSGTGIVYFANGNNGLGMVDRIVGAVLGENHPVLKATLIADYPRVGTPGMQLMTSVVDGADAVLEAYSVVVEEHGGDVTSVEESVLNRLGYILMGREDVEGAIKIFIANTHAYPDSANVWDSLAEAYRNAGNRGAAIDNYRKALTRNPDFPSAKQALAELEAEQ